MDHSYIMCDCWFTDSFPSHNYSEMFSWVQKVVLSLPMRWFTVPVPVNCRSLNGCIPRIGLFTVKNCYSVRGYFFPLSNFGQIRLIKPLSNPTICFYYITLMRQHLPLWNDPNTKQGAFELLLWCSNKKVFYTGLPVNLAAIIAALKSNG